jgi:hypothetical protein
MDADKHLWQPVPGLHEPDHYLDPDNRQHSDSGPTKARGSHTG